jgi:hypothetical protein
MASQKPMCRVRAEKGKMVEFYTSQDVEGWQDARRRWKNALISELELDEVKENTAGISEQAG